MSTTRPVGSSALEIAAPAVRIAGTAVSIRSLNGGYGAFSRPLRRKEVCSALNLDDSGREKAVLIGRLTGTAVSSASASPAPGTTSEPKSPHGHVLTPGRYVGAESLEDDGEPFEEKMKRLTATWLQQQDEAAKLDAAIAANLRGLGYGG